MSSNPNSQQPGNAPATSATTRVSAIIIALALLLLTISGFLSIIWIFFKGNDNPAKAFSVAATFLGVVFTIYGPSAALQRWIGNINRMLQPKNIVRVTIIFIVCLLLYPTIRLFYNPTPSANTSANLATQLPAFTPTPAYPHGVAFSCQICSDPSRQILVQLRGNNAGVYSDTQKHLSRVTYEQR